LLIAAFQDGQTEGVNSSKHLGFLYFTYKDLCLILTFFCSTGQKNTLNIKDLQETGTVLEMLKLYTKCVSWSKILEKQRRDVT